MNIEIGQWVLCKEGSRLILAQLSNVGFIAEVAIPRAFADGSETFEFRSVSQTELVVVDPEKLAWENGRPLLPKAEVERRQQAADAAAAKRARDLELARQPGARFEVTLGASGRWVARRVVSDLGNGKFRVAEPAFTGHVPVRKMGHAAARAVIERQLRRKVAAGETSPWNNGPRGGSSFIITL